MRQGEEGKGKAGRGGKCGRLITLEYWYYVPEADCSLSMVLAQQQLHVKQRHGSKNQEYKVGYEESS